MKISGSTFMPMKIETNSMLEESYFEVVMHEKHKIKSGFGTSSMKGSGNRQRKKMD